MQVFVLTSIDNSKWVGKEIPSISKELAPINNELLLDRTLRQLKENNIKNITIVTNESFYDFLGKDVLEISTSSIIESMLSTQPLWKGRIVFILGDVYYSNAAIKSILNCNYFFSFFGRFSENEFIKESPKIIAFSFDEWIYDKVKWALNRTNEIGWYNENIKITPGLWEFCRVLFNIPMEKNIKESLLPHQFFEINDHTSSFDSYDDYLEFLNKIKFTYERRQK